ncbi:MAG: type II secretion system protein [Planctomycetes bacterium]|nr:type II secretion system protein [Planctomycetota bacterium]
MRKGFTLVELLMVIVIISILLGIGTVTFVSLKEGQQEKSTRQLITGLDYAIKLYFDEFHKYPPMDYDGSQNLHYYLGHKIAKKTGYDTTGLDLPQQKVGPFFEFKDINLEAEDLSNPEAPRYVKDFWSRRVIYKNPGELHPDYIDIVSQGEEPSTADDDITN